MYIFSVEHVDKEGVRVSVPSLTVDAISAILAPIFAVSLRFGGRRGLKSLLCHLPVRNKLG